MGVAAVYVCGARAVDVQGSAELSLDARVPLDDVHLGDAWRVFPARAGRPSAKRGYISHCPCEHAAGCSEERAVELNCSMYVIVAK